MRIPTKNWIQLNQNDKLGNLWATFNIDIDYGSIHLPNRATVSLNEDDLADLGLMVAFARSSADGVGEKYWGISDRGKVFKTTGAAGTNNSSSWSVDAITDSPTNCKDMVTFGDDLIVAEGDDLSKLSSGTWDDSWWKTTLSGSAFAGTPVLHVADLVRTWLLMGEENRVHVITSDNEVLGDGDGRLVLPSEYTITWIRSTSNRYWIGTESNIDQEAKVFEWNGTDEVPTNSYSVNATKSYSGTVLNDILYTITSRGQLLAFTGSSFKEVARLPIANNYYFRNNLSQTVYTELQSDAVGQRGLSVINNKIHLLTTNEMGTNTTENQPSGVWVYDPNVGFYHKYSATLMERLTNTISDWGVLKLQKAGALYPINNSSEFIAGATLLNPTTLKNVLLAVELTVESRGYFITNKIYSGSIKESFQKLWLIFNLLQRSGDKIVIKYRTVEDYDYPIEDQGEVITWTDTDTFTIDSTYWSTASVGDEVQITYGSGAGASAHISSISLSGSTYTVNLDEAIPNVSGTAVARVNNWKKLGVIDSLLKQSQDFGIPESKTEWIQFKIELRNSGSRFSQKQPIVDKLELSTSRGQTS